MRPVGDNTGEESMEKGDSPDLLRIYTADIRITWIVIGMLLAVLVLFSASFGLKAYHDTGDLEESLCTALLAALLALPFIAIGMLFVAFSLRPLVFSAIGITRWSSVRFSWDEIESYEAERMADGRSGYRLLLHTRTDAFPVDLLFAGFLLSEADRPRVERYLERMGIPRHATFSSASRGATRFSGAFGETPDGATPQTALARDGSKILLHLGKANRPNRRLVVGFLLTAAIWVPICWGFTDALMAAGVPESILFSIVLFLLGGSIAAMILLVWVPKQAFLTSKGISKFPWLSLKWDEIEYYEVGIAWSPPISRYPWVWLRVYPKRSGLYRRVYYWPGRMPKADRLRIEWIMAEKGIPAYPYPGPF